MDPTPPDLPEPPRPAGAPPSSPQVPTGWQTPGVLVLLGGVLVIVGVFLPWVTATGPGGTLSVSGQDTSDWAFLLLGGFAIARGVSMARPGMFRFQLGTPLIGAAILTFLVISRWNDVQHAIDSVEAAGVTASVGIGLWAVIAGTALVAAGGLLALKPRA